MNRSILQTYNYNTNDEKALFDFDVPHQNFKIDLSRRSSYSSSNSKRRRRSCDTTNPNNDVEHQMEVSMPKEHLDWFRNQLHPKHYKKSELDSLNISYVDSIPMNAAPTNHPMMSDSKDHTTFYHRPNDNDIIDASNKKERVKLAELVPNPLARALDSSSSTRFMQNTTSRLRCIQETKNTQSSSRHRQSNLTTYIDTSKTNRNNNRVALKTLNKSNSMLHGNNNNNISRKLPPKDKDKSKKPQERKSSTSDTLRLASIRVQKTMMSSNHNIKTGDEAALVIKNEITKSKEVIPKKKHEKVQIELGFKGKVSTSVSNSKEKDVSTSNASQTRNYHQKKLRSVKDVKKWEKTSGMQYFLLSPSERRRADLEIDALLGHDITYIDII